MPLSEVAKTSVLSKKWRQNWLSHSYLVFDEAFWEKHGLNDDEDFDLQKISNIISNILLHHKFTMVLYVSSTFKFQAIPKWWILISVNGYLFFRKSGLESSFLLMMFMMLSYQCLLIFLMASSICKVLPLSLFVLYVLLFGCQKMFFTFHFTLSHKFFNIS